MATNINSNKNGGRHESYQNGPKLEEDDPLLGADIPVMTQEPIDPMDYMEQQQRKRLCFALALFSFFFALIGAAAVLNFQLKRNERLAKQAAMEAARALKSLNKHLHEQSEHIKAGCESTALLLRHCEKHGPWAAEENGDQHCSYIGYERAAYLATLFGNQKSARRWPAPAHLFALTPNRGSHLNFREWETLHPLSKQTGVVIDVVGRTVLQNEYFELLRSGDLCGQVTVISWKHEYLPELAVAMGCGPENGCPGSYDDNDFDQVWQLKYVFHPAPGMNPEDEGDWTNNSIDSNNSTGDDDASGGATRLLKHNHGSKIGWNVYATVTNQNFDPLSFSKSAGDYPDTGASHGGRWQDEI